MQRPNVETPLGGSSGAENNKIIYFKRKATTHGRIVNCTACSSHFRANTQSTICPTCSTWNAVITHNNAMRAALAKLAGEV